MRHSYPIHIKDTFIHHIKEKRSAKQRKRKKKKHDRSYEALKKKKKKSNHTSSRTGSLLFFNQERSTRINNVNLRFSSRKVSVCKENYENINEIKQVTWSST